MPGPTKPQTSLEEIQTGIGDLSAVKVFSNYILIGIYMRPDKTASGIYLPDKTRDEDRWQGSTAFVLKKGPLAFVDDDRNSFHGQDVDVGDIVVFRTSDGFSKDVNGIHCRFIEDVHVKAVVPNPEMIW